MNDIEAKLQSIFTNVNDWLKYAEAKNAGILVFSGAAIAAIMGFLGSSFKIEPEWKIGLFTCVGFLSITCIITLWSFIPKNKIKYKNRGIPSREDNLYFYGHLCKYNPQELIRALSLIYYNNDSQELINRRNIDLAAQIIMNSGITMDKNQMFKLAARIALIGLLSIVAIPVIVIAKGGY